MVLGCGERRSQPAPDSDELVEPQADVQERARSFLESYPTAAISFDSGTGYVEQVSSFLGPKVAPSMEPVQAARSFVLKHAELFGFDSDTEQISAVSVRDAGVADGRGVRGYFVRFAQIRDEIPVFGGSMLVSLTASKRVYEVWNSLVPLRSLEGAFALPETDALERTRKEVADRPIYPGEPAITRVIYPQNGVGIFAWQVDLGQWRVLLDGETGELLEIRDESYRQDARVFNENASVDGGSTSIVPIFNLQPGATTLAGGDRVSIENGAGPLLVSAAQQFRDPVGDINFDDQMVYAHMDSALTMFDGFGFTLPAAALGARTNDTTYECNAAFLGNSDSFVFSPASDGGCGGSACASAATFADIVVHETTHRILRINNGVLADRDESGGIHEGTADYFAATVTGTTCIGESFSEDEQCIRNVANDRYYPRHMASEPHAAGRVWGSALWSLRESLGRSTADRVIAEGMKNLPARPRFSDYAGNIVTQGTAFYSGLLGDNAWENFFILLQIAQVVDGVPDVLCKHGIAAPYGGFVTQDITTPDSGDTVDVTISVPAGRVLDRERGCRGGFDIIPVNANRWDHIEQLEETRSDFGTYQETPSTNGLRVRIQAGDGCNGPPRSSVRYVVYHRAP